MSDAAQHCPFLNRADARCAEYFRLDHLHHAFKHCFDRYVACPVYLERLVERRVRRAGSSVIGPSDDQPPAVHVTIGGRHAKQFA